MIFILYLLHKNGIVHRDLKPDNVLIDINLRVKIVDFGTACMMNDDCEIGVFGTHGFMAPEVESGNMKSIIDWYKADVFSICKTLHKIFEHIGDFEILNLGLLTNSKKRFSAYEMEKIISH